MKTAIIGLGNIGAAIARHLRAGGRELVVAERDADKARAFAATIGATAATLEEALTTADVIVFAVWFDVIKSLFVEHRAALSGKILVDPSNPVAPDGKGGFTKTLAAQIGPPDRGPRFSPINLFT
jgi:predicted dinucleotide-binding enzyme